LAHLLFAAYLFFFAWLVTKVPFFKKSGLTAPQLIIIFLLKVMAGIFYGWIGAYYGQMAQMVDTWAYHYESIQEYQLLKQDPVQFIRSIFHTSYESGYGNFFSTENSWWNDLKGTFLVKTIALFNLFSTGNYYINVIFYSFITLYGPVAVYRVMQDHFPNRKLAVLLATFLVPSFIYWTSGLHKDGLIFVGFALIAYQMYFGFKERRFPFYRIMLILLGLVMLLALRNFLIITTIPAMIAWILSHKLRFRPVFVFSAVYLLFIVFFFTARQVVPKLDFPAAVVTKQHEFLDLKGGTPVPVDSLAPQFHSFVTNAPQAFSLSVLRPYPSDVRHLLSLAAAIETGLLLLLFVVFLVLRNPGGRITPFILFCLFLSFSVLMMIGYTVNFLGAIVRYRSIVLPFLVVPVMARINWKRIGQYLSDNITNKNNV
jgi:hypothetical protein